MTRPFESAEKLGLACRPMGKEDMPFFLRLYTSTRAEEVAATGWPPALQAQFLEQQFAAQHRHYMASYSAAEWLVIEHEGAPIGRLYLDEGESELRIVDVALLPEARSRGFGSALVEDVFRRAGAAKKKVSIHVEKNNPAMALYRRLGFVTMEDKGVYDLLEWNPAA